MDLTKRIVDGDKTYGYIVKDGTIEYPIKEEGLWIEIVLKELISSGYILRALPYDITTPSGTPIEELPVVELKEAKITDQDLIAMEDMLVGRLPKATVQLYVSAASSKDKIYQFRKGDITIHTREELEKFLESRDGLVRNMVTYTMVMPLNSFVAEEALYTPNEYKDLPSSLKEKIKSTTMLTYAQYQKLIEVFKELGLPENYDIKDVVDMYMSFGVAGLRLDVTDMKTEESKYVFDSKVDYATVARARSDAKLKNEIPYIRNRVTTYLQSDGSWYKTATTKNGKWTPIGESTIHEQALELQKLGSNYIAPIEVESFGSEDVTTLTCGDYEVQYNDTMLIIRCGYAFRELRNVLWVSEPGNNNKRLNPEFFNIDKQGLQEEMENDALSTLLTIKTTKPCKGTSYKALMLYGANILSAVGLFLNTEDNDYNYSINPIDAEVTVDLNIAMLKTTEAGRSKLAEAGALEASRFLAVVKSYLNGSLDQSDRLYATVEYIINGLLDGTLNLDNMAQGARLDRRLQHEALYSKYLEIARKHLGLSFQEIYQKIYDVDVTTPYVELEGNGLKLRVPIIPLENAAKAYDADRNSYRLRQADQARIIGYVTKAYAELSTTKRFNRHVAIEYIMFDLTDKRSSDAILPILNKLEQWAGDVIDNNYLEKDPNNKKCKRYARQFAVDALFSILSKGKVQMYPLFNKPSGNAPIVLDFNQAYVHHPIPDISEGMSGQGTLGTLRNLAETAWESTAIVSDFTVNHAGRFITYFANAIVTPEYVIPKPQCEIQEVALSVALWNTAGAKGAERGRLICGNNLLPSAEIAKIQAKNYMCFTTAYAGNHFPVKDNKGELIDPRKIAGNIYQYVDEAEEQLRMQNIDDDYDGKFEVPTHPLFLKYPKLLEMDAFTEFSSEPRDGEKVDGAYMYRLMPYQTINREQIMARSKFVRELLDPTESNRLETNLKVEDFSGFSPEDFLANDNVLDLFAPMEGMAALYADNVKCEVIFMDGSTIAAKDIPAVADKGTHRVRRISSFRYLVSTAKETYIIVEVR